MKPKLVDEIPCARLNTGVYYLFICDCGNLMRSKWGNIKHGIVKSCGCLRKIAKGLCHVPEYKNWSHMIYRCHSKAGLKDSRYGGRGITVCDAWRNSFETFYKDMGAKPTPHHSIDRINNSGNYEPGNCKWSTIDEQAKNRRERTDGKCYRFAKGKWQASVWNNALKKEVYLGSFETETEAALKVKSFKEALKCA